MTTEIRARIQPYQKTAAALAAENDVPLQGERVRESDTGRWKTGDGIQHYNDLDYDLGVVELADAIAAFLTANPPAGVANLTLTRDGSSVTVQSSSGTDVMLPAADGSNAGVMTAAMQAKLAAIAEGATANATNAQLRDRSTHTGSQPASTISNFSSAADARIAAAAGVSVASLVAGQVPTSQLPAVALTSVQTAASQAAMLALVTQEGDIVVRSDERKTYMRNAGTAGSMADFTLLDTPVDAVTSVNGQIGIIVLGKGDVGLGNADNTSDANKPISSAQQTALNAKQARFMTGTVGTTGSTVAKTVTLDSPWASYVPVSGDWFLLTFTNGNSAGNPTLAINGTTARAIRTPQNASDAYSTTMGGGGAALYYFDGTYYRQLAPHYTYSTITSADIIDPGQTVAKLLTGQRAEELMVNEAAKARALTNKTIDGDLNTLLDIAVTSLKTTGTPDGSKFLRDDGAWAAVAGGSGGGSGYGTYAARPAANTVSSGYLYVCSDIDSVYRSNGTDWTLISIAGGIGGAEPPSSGWSWVNQGTAVETFDRGTMTLSAPSAGATENHRIRVRNLPATPYTVTTRLEALTLPGNDWNVKLILRNSSSGTFIMFGFQYQSSTNSMLIRAGKMNSATSHNSDYLNIPTQRFSNPINWFRIKDDGTNRLLQLSYTGADADFFTFLSTSRTDFVTPNQIGFAIAPYSQAVTARLRSFAVA